jgi:hypothetical protein
LPEGKGSTLFGLARLPRKAAEVLEGEGLLFLQEGVRITVVYHLFKAPGRYFRNKRETAWGSLGISRVRMVGYAFRKKVLHIPFGSTESEAVKFSLFDHRVLVIDVDPSAAQPGREGRIEVRYHTPRAPEAYALLRDLTGR